MFTSQMSKAVITTEQRLLRCVTRMSTISNVGNCNVRFTCSSHNVEKQ